LRVVLTSIGSRGDIQPIVAIAQALVRRGHRAVVAAPPDFAEWVSGLGLEFEPLGMDVNAFMQQHRETLGANILGFFKLTRRMFDEHLPAQMDALMALCRDADALVFAAGSATAPSAAEKLGIPVTGILFTTTVLPSAKHAPVVIPWRTAPRWMNRLLWRLSDPTWNVLLRKGVNEARTRHGLQPVRDVITHLYDDAGFVLAVDPGIMPPDPEWAARIPHVGFLFIEPPEQRLEPALDAWLAEGEPPVYVGFGSMMGGGPERMQRVVIDAIGSLGRRALVSRGWAKLGADLPPGWRAVGETAHALLFPRCACVVHHGGSGTTAAALRAGVPQVLVPLILDQYHHAQLLYEQGLTPKPVAMERITAPQLAAAIGEALAIPEEKREAVAVRLRASRGADAIVDRIEAAVLRRQRAGSLTSAA
jgi:vancomycin aglycone glucosyltransferase